MKMFRVVVNGNEYKVGIEELAEERTTGPAAARPVEAPRPTPRKAALKPEPAKAAEAGTANGRIIAPMPGTILRVTVNTGDTVTKGQTLLVLEAMKMENEIQAPADCVIQEVMVTQGVSVNVGDTLIVLSS
jgi:biotin carboxyl carrier protein